MPSLSQIYNQGGGGSVPSVPIGSYVDLPSDAPNLYTANGQKFLRSGVTALASAYPNVPANLTGQLFNTASLAPASLTGQSSSIKASFLMAGDGVSTMVAMPRGVQYFYMQSSDSGVTWNRRFMPWAQEVVGLVYLNSKFILVFKSGRIFTSTDGTNWTFVGLRNYQSKVARVKVANGRLFLLPYANTANALNAASAQTFLWWTADGTTWQTAEIGVSAQWCDIAHNGTMYVAISNEAGTVNAWRVTTAGDPPSGGWSNSTTAFNTTGAGTQSGMGPCCRIVNLGSTFIIVHERGSYAAYYMYYAAWASRSTDGSNWTMASVIGGTTSVDFYIPQVYVFGTTCYVSYSSNTNTAGSNVNRGTGYWTQVGQGWTAYTLSGPNTSATPSPTGGWWGDDIVLMAGKYWSATYAAQYSISGAYNSPLEKECVFNTTNVQNAYTVVQWWGSYTINGQLFSDNANKLAVMPSLPDRFGGADSVPPLWTGNSNYANTSGVINNSYLYTDDGGTTWSTKKLPIVANWSGWGKANNYFFGAPGASSPSDQAGTMQYKTDWQVDYKVYRSADLLSWTQVGSLPSNFTAYYFAQCGARIIAIGFSATLNRFASSHSDDNGATWNTAYAIENSYAATTGGVAKASEPYYEPTLKRLYVAGGPNAVANTRYVYMTDNGFAWTRISCPIFAEDYISQILVLPTGTIILFSHQSGNYYYTVDDGINWTAVRLDATSSNTGRVRATVDPVSGWIFAVGADAVYVSKNGGGSFARNNLNTTTTALQINAYNKKVSFIDQYYARTVLSDTYILNQYAINPNTGVTKYLRVE